MGSAAGALAATAASAESSESETDNNDERTNKFLLLVDQVRAYSSQLKGQDYVARSRDPTSSVTT